MVEHRAEGFLTGVRANGKADGCKTDHQPAQTKDDPALPNELLSPDPAIRWEVQMNFLWHAAWRSVGGDRFGVRLFVLGLPASETGLSSLQPPGAKVIVPSLDPEGSAVGQDKWQVARGRDVLPL